MPNTFDAYHKWLGIPSEEQPPHHYRLLGIKLFEEDPDVISSAADQRMAHLRTFQNGQHGDLSQQMLNEVATARTCLLKSQQKTAYDRQLRRDLEKLLAPSIEHGPSQTISLFPIVTGNENTTNSNRRLPTALSAPAIAASGAAMVWLLALVIGWWAVQHWHQQYGHIEPDALRMPTVLVAGNQGVLGGQRPDSKPMPSVSPPPPPPFIDPPTIGGPARPPLRVPHVVDDSPKGEQETERTPDNVADIVTALRPRQRIMGTLVNYYRPIHIQLRNTPSERLGAEPTYRADKPQYGELHLGDGADAILTLVVDEPEGEAPRIFIDLNNDEDLTNDGNGAWSASTETTLRLSDVSVDISYASSSAPYTLQMYRFKTRHHDKIFYYRDSAREGEITLNREKYQVAVLDENADGRFDDLENGTIIIDLNQDGKLVGQTDSAERHKLSEPFNIHGQVWEVASLSPDGTKLTFRASDADVSMQRYLQPGHLAPDFTGTDLAGEPLTLADEAAKSKLVLLDFWASWCGPCRSEFPHLHAIHEKYADQGVLIIGISLDSDPQKAKEVAEENGLSYSHLCDGQGWKGEVAKLFRVSGIPKTFLLDSNLKIVARDLRGEALERKIAELLQDGPVPSRRPRLLGDLIKRAPVPTDEVQDVVLEEVHTRFEVDAPRTQMERILLARTMISAAAQIEPSDAGQYVTLSEACRLASEQGALNTALKAIDELAKCFEVDAAALRMDAAVTALKSDVPKTTKRELARMSLRILDEAIEAQLLVDDAEEFAELITNVAWGMKDRPLVKEVNNRSAKLKGSPPERNPVIPR